MMFVLAAAVLASYFYPLKNVGEIFDGVIRLHVVASSDSEEDQRIKLSVRDAVLEKVSEATTGARTREEAGAMIKAELEAIEAAANDALERAGSAETARAVLRREEYPLRIYGGDTGGEAFALPAGEYESLRIVIGEGKGKNWWCVLFPPLCVNSASVVAASRLAAGGISRETASLILSDEKGECDFRFWIADAIAGIFR